MASNRTAARRAKLSDANQPSLWSIEVHALYKIRSDSVPPLQATQAAHVHEGNVSLTVLVPAALHRGVKMEAAQSGKQMQVVVAEALQRFLDTPSPRHRRVSA